MKAPICRVCLSSDILCTGCTDKLEKGAISQEDVDLARALVKLSGKFAALERAEFKKTISFDDLFLVMVPKGMAGNFIGRRGIFIRELTEALGKKRIKIVEETSNLKELVQKVLYPAQLLGVNVVYSGKKETYKVRVPHSDRRVVANPESMEKLFEKLLGSKTRIVFE